MASLFTCFCIGKRGKKITIKSKDIDGGSGTTTESPSKLKPIKAQVATFDVGRQPFKVKHYKNSLETDGVKHGGGKDSASDDDVQSSSVKPELYHFGTVGSANVGEGDGTKNHWFKIQTFGLRRGQRRRRGCVGGGGGCGGGWVGDSSGNGGVDGTKNDWFKIQTFDLRGGGGGGGGGGGVGGSSGNGGVTGGQQG